MCTYWHIGKFLRHFPVGHRSLINVGCLHYSGDECKREWFSFWLPKMPLIARDALRVCQLHIGCVQWNARWKYGTKLISRQSWLCTQVMYFIFVYTQLQFFFLFLSDEYIQDRNYPVYTHLPIFLARNESCFIIPLLYS